MDLQTWWFGTNANFLKKLLFHQTFMYMVLLDYQLHSFDMVWLLCRWGGMWVQQHFGEPANKYFKVTTVPFRRNGCNCVSVLFNCYSNKLVWLSYLIQLLHQIWRTRQMRDIHQLWSEDIQYSHASPPETLNSFISNSANKTNLKIFVSSTW